MLLVLWKIAAKLGFRQCVLYVLGVAVAYCYSNDSPTNRAYVADQLLDDTLQWLRALVNNLGGVGSAVRRRIEFKMRLGMIKASRLQEMAQEAQLGSLDVSRAEVVFLALQMLATLTMLLLLCLCFSARPTHATKGYVVLLICMVWMNHGHTVSVVCSQVMGAQTHQFLMGSCRMFEWLLLVLIPLAWLLCASRKVGTLRQNLNKDASQSIDLDVRIMMVAVLAAPTVYFLMRIDE